jgi:hypothetical protein
MAAPNMRFHGKSSLGSLIEMTRLYKEMHISETRRGESEDGSNMPKAADSNICFKRRPEFWHPQPVDPSVHSGDYFLTECILSGNYGGKVLTLLMTNCPSLFWKNFPLLH